MLLNGIPLLSRSFISWNSASAPLYEERYAQETFPLPIQPWFSAAFYCSIMLFSMDSFVGVVPAAGACSYSSFLALSCLDFYTPTDRYSCDARVRSALMLTPVRGLATRWRPKAGC